MSTCSPRREIDGPSVHLDEPTVGELREVGLLERVVDPPPLFRRHGIVASFIIGIVSGIGIPFTNATRVEAT